MLWTNACWEQTTCWVSTVMRGGVEVSMGDGGRDGIPREHCGGGEGELNVSTKREIQTPRGEKGNKENTCVAEDSKLLSRYIYIHMNAGEKLMFWKSENICQKNHEHHEILKPLCMAHDCYSACVLCIMYYGNLHFDPRSDEAG